MIRKIIFTILVIGLHTAVMAQSLSLDSCKIYALENNKKLKGARLELKASEQVSKNAFTNYFPKVDAGFAAMKANKGLIEADIPAMNLPVYDGNPANISTATQFAYFPGMSLELLDYVNTGYVSAVQPLYTGGRIRNGNKLAKLGEEFSQHNLNLTTEEVLVKTEEFYWTIIALNEKRNTLLSYRALLESLLKDVQVSFEAGLIQKSDLLKVQLEMGQVEANSLKIENGISLLNQAFAQHIGIQDPDHFSIADTNMPIQPPVSMYQKPMEALPRRDEYQMLKKAIKAEDLQKKLAMGEYMPQVAVGVQGLYLDMADNQNSYGIAFATVSVPLSGWWGGYHKIQEHKIKVDMDQNQMEENSELLLLQIDKAYKDLNESYKQIAVAEKSKSQTMEHLKVVRDNYDAGIVGTSDLLEAQAIMQKAQDALTDAKTAFKIKQALYRQVTGQNNNTIVGGNKR